MDALAAAEKLRAVDQRFIIALWADNRVDAFCKRVRWLLANRLDRQALVADFEESRAWRADQIEREGRAAFATLYGNSLPKFRGGFWHKRRELEEFEVIQAGRSRGAFLG